MIAHINTMTDVQSHAANIIEPQVSLSSVPELMMKTYGKFSQSATFKLIHSGETFILPHYNFDVVTYCRVYIDYLNMLINANVEIEIFHVDDTRHSINVLHLERTSGNSIEEVIFDNYNSNCYTYYIKVDNTNVCDISRSLSTNTSFQGECTICYQNTSLKHYYNCKIIDKFTHHGICGDCYTSWQSANPNNNCPLCRERKK